MSRSPPTCRRSRGSPGSASSSWRNIPAGRSTLAPWPAAAAYELDNWDRSAINLPFSRIAVAASEPIYVPKDADSAALEAARLHVENELNRLTARAYEIADRKGSAQP